MILSINQTPALRLRKKVSASTVLSPDEIYSPTALIFDVITLLIHML